MRQYGRTWLLLAVAATGLAGNVHATTIKCWTNKQGVRECGNSVPPEYAQKKTRILNDRGMTVEVEPRAKTKAEVAAEAKRKRKQKEEERKRTEQKARDKVLLATFATDEDIVMARDRQLSAIDGTIEITQLGIKKLTEKLAKFQKRADSIKGHNKPVPENLASDMELVSTRIKNKKDYIASKKEERRALEEKYNADLKRFRELMKRRDRH